MVNVWSIVFIVEEYNRGVLMNNNFLDDIRVKMHRDLDEVIAEERIRLKGGKYVK